MRELRLDPRRSRALDIGCGGGLLTEELAKMGFAAIGVDPSAKSIDIARAHAAESGLAVDYRIGFGNELSFDVESFDAVFCCDALEHIRNWDEVIAEISRVLRSGGVFFFDTINRTFASKLRSILIAQEWKWTRFAPPDTHVWEMFITPDELTASLTRHGLNPGGIAGTAEKGNPIQAFRLIRQYSRGKISAAEFGRGIDMQEGPVISGSYMGYATKP